MKRVYNSASPGEIEISLRPSDRSQVGLKLTTSTKHFALIKNGEMPQWLRKELLRFNVNHLFEEEGFFEKLNEEISPINILMGSRSFYEGWDSNRPNIINFINTGGADAKKFILQSVGRGVRIEPFEDRRKRLVHLYNEGAVQKAVFDTLKKIISPLETVFIFGTNGEALTQVLKQLEPEAKKSGERLLAIVDEEARKRLLLVPLYKPSVSILAKDREQARFPISKEDLELLRDFIDYLNDERLLVALYDASQERIQILMDSVRNTRDFYAFHGQDIRNPSILTRRVLDFFNLTTKVLEELKELK